MTPPEAFVCLPRRLLLAACAIAALPAVARADYRLGPQDQLQIRVFDLRAGTGQAYQWPAFEGVFSVNAAGRVALPLLGEVEAADSSTAQLAVAIAEKLQARVGLAERPEASVQVTRYRPFYVVGTVEKAGEYEYRPGLTVLQAVSMAGGTSRLTGDALLGFEREALSGRGELRLLSVDRLALLTRQARLDAEIKGQETITLPPEVVARSQEPDIARLVRQEQMLFESRAYSLRSQTETLQQTEVLLQQQVDSLKAKDASLIRQLEIIKTELTQVTGLVTKGLAVLPRQLALQQHTAQFESDRLDIQLNVLRAQQDLAKTQRDVLELSNNRRNEALQEATEVRNRLAENGEKTDTAQRLLAQAAVRAPLAIAADASAAARPTYVLVRRHGGVAEARDAQESDAVEPGDVVRVQPGRSAGVNVMQGDARPEPSVPLAVN